MSTTSMRNARDRRRRYDSRREVRDLEVKHYTALGAHAQNGVSLRKRLDALNELKTNPGFGKGCQVRFQSEKGSRELIGITDLAYVRLSDMEDPVSPCGLVFVSPAP